MKKRWLLIAMLLLPILVSAQSYRTIELKPIGKQGWRYSYDLKKISTDGLQFPLLAVDDEEVNRYLKSSRTWKSVGSFVTIVPLIYIISLPPTTYIDSNTFWLIIGGTFLTQLGFEALSHMQLGKAIDRYNYLIVRPSGQSLGIQLTWKFL